MSPFNFYEFQISGIWVSAMYSNKKLGIFMWARQTKVELGLFLQIKQFNFAEILTLCGRFSTIRGN